VVAPPEVLARATVEIAKAVEAAVYAGGKRADRELAVQLKRRRELGPSDGRQISAAVFALFRWRGWVEPLGDLDIAERLMLSLLLDEPQVPAIGRILARWSGWDAARLMPLGDAPDWKALSEGFRRLLGGHAVTADPWRLFPPFLRDHLPVPPGAQSVKFRHMELLQVLQRRPPLWVRVQGAEPDRVWKSLRELGVKPWVHRRVKEAAQVGPEVDVYHLAPFERGQLEIQDLASQAVGLVCDPDPGERWWDACTGAGGKALHLAAQMGGRGVVVATDRHEGRLKDAVRRARRSPFRNITTKVWDGTKVAGKPGSFDGVLVDAPCSGIGTWRRNPDARWSLDREAIPRLAAQQSALLEAASAGVRVGGTLVYSVCTVTPTETRLVVEGFLARHREFRLDPFPHPLGGEETDGTLLIWPQDGDSDAMYVARMVRTGPAPTAAAE
jgi:16S rRNA (cytosine967-C5)-methyltransferase